MNTFDCLDEYRTECELQNYSGRTIKGHYNNIKKFLIFMDTQLAVTQIEEMKTPHIKRYIQHLISKDLKPSYINGIMKSIRGYFKYAFSEAYITVNPSLRVGWQREGKVVIQTFADDEVRRMLSAFNSSDYLSVRNKLILAIAFDTGARNTEICELQESNIRDNVILIHGKGNKERHVPLTPYVKKLLMKYGRIKTYYFSDKYALPDNLLLSRTGRPLTKEALEHVFKEAGKRAGVREEIRCSPHTARHYYAQTNLRNGLDVYSCSRLLGHENINITKRYLQSLQDANIVEMAVKTSPLQNIKL